MSNGPEGEPELRVPYRDEDWLIRVGLLSQVEAHVHRNEWLSPDGSRRYWLEAKDEQQVAPGGEVYGNYEWYIHESVRVATEVEAPESVLKYVDSGRCYYVNEEKRKIGIIITRGSANVVGSIYTANLEQLIEFDTQVIEGLKIYMDKNYYG